MPIAAMQLPEIRSPEGMWANVFSYHPFAPILDRAEGIYLYDTEGNRYIDASGGPLAINLGHGDRRVSDAIAKQAEKFAYCHPIFSNAIRAELCEKVARVTPGDLNTTYTVCGGSEAVETAMKLARQYHMLTGSPEKHMVIATWDSYHGMSLGALAVSGNPGHRNAFNPMLLQWPHIHHYHNEGRPEGMSDEENAIRCAGELEEAIHFAGAQHISAFMATPVGAGKDYGLVPPPEYWRAIREICDRHNVLLIADEVVTGFGRTGKWFAMEHFGVQADIMTTGKGISSLYMPFGAVTVSDRVNEPFTREGVHFLHGFTNAGHGLACAAGSRVIDILHEDGLIENSAEVGEHLHSKRETLLKHRTIADVRGKGLLMIAELVADKETMDFFAPEQNGEETFQAIALKNGLAFYATLYGPRRPSTKKRGLPIFITPPLCITREQVDDLIDRLDQTLTELEETLGA